MYHTKTQVQLTYHQTLNRICEMEMLAEQMRKLAESYMKEERGKARILRENPEEYGKTGESPGKALMEQARELREVAADWYQQARKEYHEGLQEVDREESFRNPSR